MKKLLMKIFKKTIKRVLIKQTHKHKSHIVDKVNKRFNIPGRTEKEEAIFFNKLYDLLQELLIDIVEGAIK